MPRQATFTRKDLIDAALSHLREEGLRGFSARNVTGRIPSSTAPLYSHFNGIEELEKEAMRQTKGIVMRYATARYTDHPFLNIGLGLVIFAREEKMLYQTLFLEKNAHQDILDEMRSELFEIMSSSSPYRDLPKHARHRLMEKMSIVTHGLASMICSGITRDNSDEFILTHLSEIGEAVIRADLETHSIPLPEFAGVPEFLNNSSGLQSSKK